MYQHAGKSQECQGLLNYLTACFKCTLKRQHNILLNTL